jgi:hypothetical protein
VRTIYRIHPGIGIARLGNSHSEFFIGPEAPGFVPLGSGPYRDGSGRIKRQGARFRVFAYEFGEKGRLERIREVTTAEARIEWQVHLANRKAAADTFPPQTPPVPRNAEVSDRSRLVIDAGRQTIGGPEQEVTLAGRFLESPVELGHLRTDEGGRLIVLGGFGVSRSVPEGMPILEFANNDGWHDDSSDGPVTATVTVGDEPPVAAEPAWVIVAPPDFAPGLGSVTSLYDVVFQVATELEPGLIPRRVSFTRDVYPILARAAHLSWLNEMARFGHGAETGGNFLAPAVLAQLASAGTEAAEARRAVLRRVRNPDGGNTGAATMPRLKSGLDPANPAAGMSRQASLTRYQYGVLRNWADGLFEADWTGSPLTAIPYGDLPELDRPAGLDRAAPEPCVGDPFFPGIECGFIMALRQTYERPFRIARTKQPGELTGQMAVPWQADFVDCGRLWWPAQRPNEVRREGDWADWVPDGFGHLDMVENWSGLGFIVHDGEEYVERERLLGVPVA